MAITRAFTTSQLDSRVDFYYTATSGQTTFSGSDDNGSTLSYTASGKKDVYLNGTLLIESDDYVATNGTSVVLQATTQAGDIVHISVNKVMSNLVNLVDTSVDLNGNELILDADGDTSITADTDDQIDFKIGGTDRLSISSTGKVTSTQTGAGVRFEVETTGSTGFRIYQDDSDGFTRLQTYDTTGTTYGKGMSFWTAPSGGATAERMRIDSSGRVTIASIPSFLAYFSGVPATDGTITSGSDYVFESTKYNVGSHYNTSNGRFTAPVAGLYEFNFSAYYTNSNSSTARMQTAWKVNGTEYSGADALGHILRDPNQCGGVITGEQTIVIDLSANDYVTVFARGGINRVYRGHCHFSGRLIG